MLVGRSPPVDAQTIEDDPRRLICHNSMVMSEASTFQVAPTVLVWAREQRGLSVDDAARLLQIKPATLAVLEAGDKQPSLSQLRRMSDKYKRPLIVLLLDEPPKSFTPLKDFRRLPAVELGDFSPQLHDEIKRALDQQEIYIDLKRQLGQSIERPDLPRDPQNATRLASEILILLGVTTSIRQGWAQPRIALSEWRSRVESLGILVLETSRVKLKEMRGFSLSESSPPVIVLNGEDSERGKIFTMLHELAHLCMRQPGVCDLHSRSKANDDVEIYCNAVAGQVLLPQTLLESLTVYRAHSVQGAWSDQDVDSIVRIVGGASREVVLRRLLDNGKISRLDYEQRREQLQQEYEEFRDQRRRKSKGGPLPHYIQLRDRGRPFIRSAFEAYADGFVSLSQLVDLAGVRTKYLQNMQTEAYK
jgi:Zn-dependent peptidase ImmA (M78 family)/DNA-binding XRE family transcriptional regulator